MKKILLTFCVLAAFFGFTAHAIEFELPPVSELAVVTAPLVSVEYYAQFIFLIIIFGVFATSLGVLLLNAKKYYNTQVNEEKDRAYFKMRDALISLGVVVVSVLGLWALYPQYLTFSPSRIAAIITALF